MEDAMSYDEMVALYNERTGPMVEARDRYASWAEVPVGIQAFTIAWDASRRAGSNEHPMSERNALSLAGIVAQAMTAAQRGRDDSMDDELRALRKMIVGLKDPTVVHANMLKGTIARLSTSQFEHLQGDEA